MKIISKHKDYYDHLVGHYGYDETIVYDRRNKSTPWNLPKFGEGQYLLSICNKFYPVVHVNGKFYHEYSEDLPKNYHNHSLFFSRYYYKGWRKSSEFNIKHRTPVILCEQGCRGAYVGEDVFIPTLSQFGIPSIIDAHTMYQMIYNFLSWLKDNPEPPNNQSNSNKIVAHGFDLRKSFRPKMKD